MPKSELLRFAGIARGAALAALLFALAGCGAPKQYVDLQSVGGLEAVMSDTIARHPEVIERVGAPVEIKNTGRGAQMLSRSPILGGSRGSRVALWHVKGEKGTVFVSVTFTHKNYKWRLEKIEFPDIPAAEPPAE